MFAVTRKLLAAFDQVDTARLEGQIAQKLSVRPYNPADNPPPSMGTSISIAPLPPQNLSMGQNASADTSISIPTPPSRYQPVPAPPMGIAISIAPPLLRISRYRLHQRAPQYLLSRPPPPPSVSACTSPTSGYGGPYCAAPPSLPTCSNLTNGSSNKTAGSQRSNCTYNLSSQGS